MSNTKKYVQKRFQEGGSTREIQLQLSTTYSVKDIISLGKSLFTNEDAQIIFDNSDIKLGFYSNQVIEEFATRNGKFCGLWDYYKTFSIPTSKINLYLYTTLNEDFVYDDSQCSEFLDLNKEDEKNQERTIENVTETKSSEEVANKIKDSERDDCKIIESEKVTSASGNEKSDVDKSKQNHFHEDERKSVQVVKRNLDEAQIQYFLITTSKYSKETSITERDNYGIYWKVIDDDQLKDQVQSIDISEFDPSDYGFDVSSISINKITYLQAFVNDDYQKTYTIFGENHPPHTIVYDSDIICGFSHNCFGMGIIPNCFNNTSIFSWYKNDSLYVKGPLKLWLHNVQLDDKDSEWFCEIECCNGIKYKSKKVVMTVKDGVPKVEKKIPSQDLLINKSDLNISNDLIGAGQQGKVYKGVYEQKDVAVKIIIVSGQNQKYVEKELLIMQSLNHENFIKLIGYCKDTKKLYLVMEYFNGQSLRDVLSDDDWKEEFNLNEARKIDIFYQLCMTVAFLHERDNSIIYRDLKPDNILLNKNGQIKVCDLGLSTFNTVLTKLRTTMNANAVGTRLYMASEIFLDTKIATPNSDIWSLGCTAIELFNEEPVWDVMDEDQLREKLINREIPKVSEVPETIRAIIIKCLSYDESLRPKATEILKFFKK